MPLKKKTQKASIGIDNSAVGKSESNATMVRRSSTPLIITCGGDKVNKKMSPISNSCSSTILHGKEETVPEPPGCIQSCRLQLGKVLGEGEYGFVYKGTYLTDDFKKVSRFSTGNCFLAFQSVPPIFICQFFFRSTSPSRPFTMNIYPSIVANSLGKPKS